MKGSMDIQKVYLGAPKLTWLSCPPVANFRSKASHSTHRTHPLCPDSVCEGVSVNKSHKRALVSPEPVARRFPVGEKDAQSIGDEWPDGVALGGSARRC